jgi:hypothetical protein
MNVYAASVMKNHTARLQALRRQSSGIIERPLMTSAESFPWEKLCFGFRISGATVTIMAGEVIWGLEEIVVAETSPITIAYDYSYIGVETDGSTASIIGPSTSRAVFRSDSAKRRKWLWQFRLVSGAVSMIRIGHMGNWEINGSFAP